MENGWTCEHSDLVVPNCYHARCGDGRVNSLPYVDAAGRSLQETCDDGNTQSGDGCSSACAIEDGWVCTQPTGIGQHLGPLSLTYVIEDFMPPCLKISCGDGIVEASEQCDDKNTVSGDGCSATCEIEPDFYCATPGQPCVAVVCGDGATTATFRRVTAARPTASWSPAGNAAFPQSRVGECDSLLEETRANWANHMSKPSADGTSWWLLAERTRRFIR